MKENIIEEGSCGNLPIAIWKNISNERNMRNGGDKESNGKL